MTTEDEIRAYTIGEVKAYAIPVVVVDYDPAWPGMFAAEAARIRGVLGDAVVSLEHVGSTSVPGLCAKPIIDMQLAVPDSADEAAYVPALEAAGYVLRIREPHWFEHRVFKGPDVNINLHVFTVGCSEFARTQRFRDWLRAHGDDRDRYAALKRDLAKQAWAFVQHYADAKTPFIDEIVAKARRAAG